MKLRFEPNEYSREFGHFSVIAKEGEESELPKVIKKLASIEGIDGVSQDYYSTDFVFCKHTYEQSCIRKIWKAAKK